MSSIGFSTKRRSRTIVAIPARDEAERIELALIALDRQMTPPDGVLLLLNNCIYETEAIARRLEPRARAQPDRRRSRDVGDDIHGFHPHRLHVQCPGLAEIDGPAGLVRVAIE